MPQFTADVNSVLFQLVSAVGVGPLAAGQVPIIVVHLVRDVYVTVLCDLPVFLFDSNDPGTAFRTFLKNKKQKELVDVSTAFLMNIFNEHLLHF